MEDGMIFRAAEVGGSLTTLDDLQDQGRRVFETIWPQHSCSMCGSFSVFEKLQLQVDDRRWRTTVRFVYSCECPLGGYTEFGVPEEVYLRAAEAAGGYDFEKLMKTLLGGGFEVGRVPRMLGDGEDCEAW